MKKTKYDLKKEELGWTKIAEKSLNNIWKNEKDEKSWSRFGSQPKLKKFKESERAKSHAI